MWLRDANQLVPKQRLLKPCASDPQISFVHGFGSGFWSMHVSFSTTYSVKNQNILPIFFAFFVLAPREVSTLKCEILNFSFKMLIIKCSFHVAKIPYRKQKSMQQHCATFLFPFLVQFRELTFRLLQSEERKGYCLSFFQHHSQE